MLLEEIVPTPALENSEFECKARLNRDDVEGWLKTVAGFANADGGTLYIGVEDKSNKLIGFTRDKADSERNYFNNQVNEHISPCPPYKVGFLRYMNGDKELYVLEIRVSVSPVRPVVLRFKNVPSIYMRREGFTNGATYEEIIEMSLASSNKAYDTLPSDVPYKKDDFTHLTEFYRQRNGGREISEKALRSMGFFGANGMLANGALLFNDSCEALAPGKTAVQCSVFSGFTKGSDRVVTVNRFKGDLASSIGFMTSFVEQRMNHSFVKEADSRVNMDAYPARALFEGVVNAVAHRDYFLDGTQVQVDMFKDRLEISSPGSFFQGAKIEKTYDLSSIISKRRNELVCNVLVACNAMEAAGTGFDKIVEEYAQADEAHKPYIYSASDHFTLVLPDLTYGAGLADNSVAPVEFAPVPSGTKHDAFVLGLCYRSAKTAAEIAGALGISDSSYFRKKVLGNLVAHGYLETHKAGRATLYRTNRDEVRAG